MLKLVFSLMLFACFLPVQGQSAVNCSAGYEKVHSCSWAVPGDDPSANIEVLALCKAGDKTEFIYEHIVSGDFYMVREEVALMSYDPDFPDCKAYTNASTRHGVTFCENQGDVFSYLDLGGSTGMSAVFFCK